MINLNVNGKDRAVDVAADTPLLWVLRETLGLTGTKFGCGMAQCGACTVHLDGEAVALVRHARVARRRQEGHDHRGPRRPTSRHPLQQAWIDEDVPQCGYCQSGQIMAAAVLLARERRSPPTPTSTTP